MTKQPFLERFINTNKFYDNVYHHHKATFKGLATFFSDYCEVQKDYANQIFKVSESAPREIADFTQQMPNIQKGIREVTSNLERVSQLHFNFGQRLRQIGDFCKEQYQRSKKYKEKTMRVLREKSQEQYNRVKLNKNKQMLKEKEKQICKRLYDALDNYYEEQIVRTQKLKEQLLIYFSLSKKISQKQLELASAYNIKVAHFQVQAQIKPKAVEIEDLLIEHYNGLGGDQIQRKDRQLVRTTPVNRDSLKQSLIIKERNTKIQNHQNKLQVAMQKYQKIPEDHNYPKENTVLVGVFDTKIIRNYRKFSGLVQSQNLKQIFYGMLSCFYYDGDSQIQGLLTVIKTNLKTKSFENSSKIKNENKFLKQHTKNEDYFLPFNLLIGLSKIYDSKLQIKEFEKAIIAKKHLSIQENYELNWRIKTVILDTLLDSLIIIRQDFSLLYDEYLEILCLISSFGNEFLRIDTSLLILIFTRKLLHAIDVTNSIDSEPIQEMLKMKINDFEETQHQLSEYKMSLGHGIIHQLTQKMSYFFKHGSNLSNFVKIGLLVEKVMPKNYFSAMEHFHGCLRIAGYQFLVNSQSLKKVLTVSIWQGEERLKNMVELLQECEFESLIQSYFQPLGEQISGLLGVGRQVATAKLNKQFSRSMFQLIQGNLKILDEGECIDRQGYILRLGNFLARIDVDQPQNINYYDSYFSVLQSYLKATEQNYDKILEQSRKTELWIVEENSQATQNCTDFCSLLYKPFEFLLTSLKSLEEEKVQTQFTTKYSQFIKLKLNNALKGQIQKYVDFLSVSLNGYRITEPLIQIKSKHKQFIKVTSEQQSKERYRFKEVTRRLYNLMFLKDQLNEIVGDFLDEDVYDKLNHSIFNLDKLKNISLKTSRKEIMENISQIVEMIQNSETELLHKIADVTVFSFMNRLFTNLYFQDEKGVFEQFFSSKEDYKLSEYTLVKAENQLQEVMANVSRNIPSNMIDIFSQRFARNFFYSYRRQSLNGCKFKLPVPQKDIISYLTKDISFACSTFRQKWIDQDVVREEIEEPFKDLTIDMQMDTQKVIEIFSEANLKSDNRRARYALSILSLRKQEKARDYVKKYMNTIK